jgi:hypothetical protein
MKKSFFFFLITAVILFVSSCRRDEITTDSSAKIEFSTDTLLFDTVFTTVGSVTKIVKVYNNNAQAIQIGTIDLAGGANSQFRINVNGDNGTHFENIFLESGDSLFIFVEVTVDPTNSNTPYVIEDQILFNTNGNNQVVQLAAWGQDAYFHGGTTQNELYVLPCGAIWNNDKPHVIYGIVAVDEGCNLTINEGTHVYVHAKSGLFVYKGSLNIQGSLNNEVVFEGDRLEADYATLPGQWGIQYDVQIETGVGPGIYSVTRGGIWLYQCNSSSINYAIIKNGGMGIQVDTLGNTSATGFALSVTNTKIDNMSGVGLFAQGSSIYGNNLLVTNCAESCANLSVGGTYQFDNCTFANYWNNGNRTSPAFYLTNYYEDINQNIQTRTLTNCLFRNCIMWGNNATLGDFSEFVVDLKDPELQQVQFKYCLVDTDVDVSDDGNVWESMVNNQNPYFCDYANGNFRVNQDAPRMIGGPFTFGPDISGNNNGDWKGCYDYNGSCN